MPIGRMTPLLLHLPPSFARDEIQVIRGLPVPMDLMKYCGWSLGVSRVIIIFSSLTLLHDASHHNKKLFIHCMWEFRLLGCARGCELVHVVSTGFAVHLIRVPKQSY